jgi:hypothetical protein
MHEKFSNGIVISPVTVVSEADVKKRSINGISVSLQAGSAKSIAPKNVDNNNDSKIIC